MIVQTQFGCADIDPADVVSIKPMTLSADYARSDELTYCVEYKDHSAAYARNTVCVTETVAKGLSESSGVKMPERKVITKTGSDNIFVPLAELLLLDEWEWFFFDFVEKGINPEPVPNPAPGTSFSDNSTLYEENHRPVSLIEQVFRELGG